MKIVLDTNCFLRAVPNKSDYHCILTALRQGRYTLCFSNDILMEYEEMLLRFYSKQTAVHILNFLYYSIHTLMIVPYFQWDMMIVDPDDNKFVDCALNAGVDYLVTNDRHFNILKSVDFPPIQVIDMDTFRKIILMG